MDNKIRIIIAGGRDFNDYDRLELNCDYLVMSTIARNYIRIPYEIEIVSGTAKGADKLGEKWAKNRSLDITRFPAEWDLLGKSAGYVRNEKMAKHANYLIAFWDGKSKGTQHMISLAAQNNIVSFIIPYKNA